MTPPCTNCVKANKECRRKPRGPGCERCAQRKVGCSAAGRKREKKVVEPGLLTERGTENVPAPWVELSDGLMEQVEAMAGTMKGMEKGIWELVKGIGKLTEAIGKMAENKGKETEEEEEGRRRGDGQRRRWNGHGGGVE
jgi:hypothetical protein